MDEVIVGLKIESPLAGLSPGERRRSVEILIDPDAVAAVHAHDGLEGVSVVVLKNGREFNVEGSPVAVLQSRATRRGGYAVRPVQ